MNLINFEEAGDKSVSISFTATFVGLVNALLQYMRGADELKEAEGFSEGDEDANSETAEAWVSVVCRLFSYLKVSLADKLEGASEAKLRVLISKYTETESVSEVTA